MINRGAVLVLTLLFAVCSHAYTVNVEANTEECFSEIVQSGDKVMGSYHVISGGMPCALFKPLLVLCAGTDRSGPSQGTWTWT